MTLILLTLLLVTPYLALTALAPLRPEWRLSPSLRGRIGLALLFFFTGAAHFTSTTQMTEMLPRFVPAQEAVILATGVFELAAAAALLIPATARLAGWALILFLIAVFPANIYAAFTNASFGGGGGPAYLLVRAPFQLLLIGWAYWFAARKGAH